MQSRELFLSWVNKGKEQGTVLYFSRDTKLTSLTTGQIDLSRQANTQLPTASCRSLILRGLLSACFVKCNRK